MILQTLSVSQLFDYITCLRGLLKETYDFPSKTYDCQNKTYDFANPISQSVVRFYYLFERITKGNLWFPKVKPYDFPK